MPTPRDVWGQMPSETPFSRYPVPNLQPNPGLAGIVSAVGEGVGNALAYRQRLEANLRAAAEKVAEAEAKAKLEAAAEQAKQQAEYDRQVKLREMQDKAAVDLQAKRDEASMERTKLQQKGAKERAGMYAGGKKGTTATGKMAEWQAKMIASNKSAGDVMSYLIGNTDLYSKDNPKHTAAAGEFINRYQQITQNVLLKGYPQESADKQIDALATLYASKTLPGKRMADAQMRIAMRAKSALNDAIATQSLGLNIIENQGIPNPLPGMPVGDSDTYEL